MMHFSVTLNNYSVKFLSFLFQKCLSADLTFETPT